MLSHHARHTTISLSPGAPLAGVSAGAMPSSWSVPRSVAMNPNTLDTLATGEPQSIALAGVDGRALTFAEMGDEVRRLAGQLHTLGIRPNDRIGIVLENGA